MSDRKPSGGAVLSVIEHRPKPGQARQYEAWLAEIVPVAQGFCGHRGVNVIRPHGGSGTYTIILHFDSLESLRGWLESPTRAALIDKVKPLLAADETVAIKTGLEFWFTPPPGRPHAQPWKQFLVTLSAIFPLTVVVPWALNPLLAALPAPGRTVVASFITAVVIVALMTWVIMPRYTRLIANWLYR